MKHKNRIAEYLDPDPGVFSETMIELPEKRHPGKILDCDSTAKGNTMEFPDFPPQAIGE